MKSFSEGDRSWIDVTTPEGRFFVVEPLQADNRSSQLDFSGSTLPTLDDHQLPHHRREVRRRAAGLLQVREPGLTPWIILVRRLFPWERPPRAVESDPVEQITKLDVGPILFCQPSQPRKTSFLWIGANRSRDGAMLHDLGAMVN
jgi:hypothetical protein